MSEARDDWWQEFRRLHIARARELGSISSPWCDCIDCQGGTD